MDHSWILPISKATKRLQWHFPLGERVVEEAIIRNSENDFKVERAQGMLNNLKTQPSDTRVVAFWKEIDFQSELESTKNQIELAKADGVLHIITATNKSQEYVIEAQHQDLLALREPTAGKQGERHPSEKRHRDFEEAIPGDRAKRKAGIYRGEDDRNNKMKIATDIVSSSDESNVDLEDVVFEDEDEVVRAVHLLRGGNIFFRIILRT